MMEKDFSEWHRKKSWIQKDKVRPFFHEREVWFASLGLNIGSEQDGKGTDFLRPIIVIKKFNNDILWGIPLTKTEKRSHHYFSFILNGSKSTAIVSQLRLIDARRLVRRFGRIDSNSFTFLKEKTKALLP